MNKLNDCKMVERTDNTNQQNVREKAKNVQTFENQQKISQKEIEAFNDNYANDSDHKSDSKFTKLHFAAKKNSKEIGELLISKGADINAMNIIYLNIKILFLIKII